MLKKNNMENNQLFIGLDIGTTKIVAMIGELNEYDKLKIIGIGKSKSLLNKMNTETAELTRA